MNYAQIFGFIGGLLNALFRGHTFALPPLPPTDNGGLFPSSETLRTYAIRVSATEFFGVSSTVVGLARCEGGLELFRSMKRVVVGGAPMPRENGDWIVQHGVHLVEVFGSTEAGSLVGHTSYSESITLTVSKAQLQSTAWELGLASDACLRKSSSSL